MLIDTHAHITHHRFDDDREAMIQRAREAGLAATVAIGDNLESSQAAVALAAQHADVFATVGIHPHHANDWNPEVEGTLRQILAAKEANRVFAVGEIGIDYHYDFATPEVQIPCFAAQLGLAKEFDLPAVVHCRESRDDIVKTMAQEQDGSLRAVVHCFSEDLATAERLLELGFYLGIGGMITFKHMEPLRETLKVIGIERVIVETDAPYLSPIPLRGKRNEPAHVVHTAAKIADLMGVSAEEVATITTRNAVELFRLPFADC